MALHIIKLCVGVEDVDHLAQLQKARLKRDGMLAHITRNTPRQAEQVLQGGSLYWVIKRFVRVRQRIVGIEKGINAEGKPSCALVLDSTLVSTQLKEFRAFQGWRYFREEDSPADLNKGEKLGRADEILPVDMVAELKTLGLI